LSGFCVSGGWGTRVLGTVTAGGSVVGEGATVVSVGALGGGSVAGGSVTAGAGAGSSTAVRDVAAAILGMAAGGAEVAVSSVAAAAPVVGAGSDVTVTPATSLAGVDTDVSSCMDGLRSESGEAMSKSGTAAATPSTVNTPPRTDRCSVAQSRARSSRVAGTGANGDRPNEVGCDRRVQLCIWPRISPTSTTVHSGCLRPSDNETTRTALTYQLEPIWVRFRTRRCGVRP
jgi:hypothetical protein